MHQMLSKWLDIATYMAAFHYQCSQYDKYRPPAFGHHTNLRNLTRERERETGMTMDEAVEQLKTSLEVQHEEEVRHKNPKWARKMYGFVKRKRSTKNYDDSASIRNTTRSANLSTHQHSLREKKNIAAKEGDKSHIPMPRSFQEQFSIAAVSKQSQQQQNQQQLDASHGSQSARPTMTRTERSTRIVKTDPIEIPYPSLFLQETTHLVSLLSGVALSTLRNDIDGADSPLAEYFPGQPMPPVNPDDVAIEMRQEWDSSNPCMSAIYFMLGLTRDDRYRTLYNAARPLQILGGVSDLEIERLQMAHGPYAKVALCSMFVQEFVSREALHGSTGEFVRSFMYLF